MIELNDLRFWLYAAVDPATNQFLHIRVFKDRTQAQSQWFVSELLEKHELDETLFLADGAPWLHAALHHFGCDFEWETHGRRNAVERIFKEVKRRTYQSSNHFRNASVESAESWLETLAFAWNQLI